MKLNASILIAPLVDILTGKVIEAGTHGDSAKILARAQELVAINAALIQINSGDATGIAALQAAITPTALSPGEALALNSLFAAVANQLALLSNIEGSTLIGQAATAILDSIIQTANGVAQAYVKKYQSAGEASAAPAAKPPGVV